MATRTQHHTIREEVCKLFVGVGISEVQAKDMEIGIFNFTIDYATEHDIPLTWMCELFREIYIAKARSIYTNVNPDTYVKNEDLRKRILEKEMKPHELAFLKAEGLFPDKWQTILEKEAMLNQLAYENIQSSMTSDVTCGKCKKNKITYYELQTRSADEPMTCFYRCLACGNRWKN